MIPHTVPSNPTNGETDPIDARKFMPRSIRSISRVMVNVIERSIRLTSDARRSARSLSASPRELARRHSRIAATNTTDSASFGSTPVSSYSLSSEPPDQKASSNCCASFRSRRINVTFSTTIAQHQIDAKTSNSITNLTNGSAAIKSPQIVKSELACVTVISTEFI